ncbi:hypothetical protein FUAX_05450 [Fulvitalea axinellae]|uniref:Restriction endonuclease type II NgoFVII C-terminal B3-like DNA-binding domain-containing protein n=1 Tax=Fulvitalea axinellae TaxID=1182444 RepID=A0AAU9CE87_9BACT|nr:hypothetical protein FUAX_05450 [Fulvitalea axinellae]
MAKNTEETPLFPGFGESTSKAPAPNSFAGIDRLRGGGYEKLLRAFARFSGLFSESPTPYLYYRAAENIFCKSFGAENLSRSDTAFDAKYDNIGVGLKTFLAPKSDSVEKVAEFNRLAKELALLDGLPLALRLAELRNNRVAMAKRIYGIEKGVYHIVARRPGELLLFETGYGFIDTENIRGVKRTSAGISFRDGENEYFFNRSKSTLYRRFRIPADAYSIKVEILDDPYDALLGLSQGEGPGSASSKDSVPGENYVILPLYGYRRGERTVFPKSGINQWNASGRRRDPGEVYLRVPGKEIRNAFPDFFPGRDEPFLLSTPTGEELSAKLCQEDGKALMTNPNKALSDWLLRKVLRLREKEPATMGKLDALGVDSVRVDKLEEGHYSIDVAEPDAFEKFKKLVLSGAPEPFVNLDEKISPGGKTGAGR